MVAFSRTLARVLLLAGIGQAACLGGQTGQETAAGAGGGPCSTIEPSEQDAAALLAQYAGTYEAPGVRSESDDRCPAEGQTTVRVTIASAVSEEELGEKPCGARFIQVSVEVSTDDGEPSTSFEGWLSEEGIVTGEGHTVVLPSSTNQVLSLSGFGSLRTIEDCCLQPPPEDIASGLELGSTGLLTLRFADPATDAPRTTELSLLLTTSSPAGPCGVIEAAFELHTEAGDLAASGAGSMESSSVSCDGTEPPCLSIIYSGSGSVADQQLLLGYADYGAALSSLDVYFEGTTRGGQLENRLLSMLANTDPAGPGEVLTTEVP